MKQPGLATLLTFALVLLGAAGVPAQEKEPDTPSADVAEAIDGLKTALKEKIDADQIHFAKILGDKWPEADKKQRKAVHKLIKRNLRSKNPEILETTVDAISMMTGGKKNKWAEESAKILEGETKKKTTEKNLTYFGQVVVGVGKLGSKRGRKMLTKLLNYKEFDIIASAAAGLAYYKDAELEVRREVVGEMLKIYTSAESAARDGRDNTAVRKHDTIKPAMESSLKALTGQQLDGALQWQSWWNKVGKRGKTWES